MLFSKKIIRIINVRKNMRKIKNKNTLSETI